MSGLYFRLMGPGVGYTASRTDTGKTLLSPDVTLPPRVCQQEHPQVCYLA